MFFNKENVQVVPKADTDLQLNIQSIIPFYISEVISNATISQVYAQAYTKDLKVITIINNFVEIFVDPNGDYLYTFTPSAISKDTLHFRFKVIVGTNEHLVDSCAFSVHTIGVP